MIYIYIYNDIYIYICIYVTISIPCIYLFYCICMGTFSISHQCSLRLDLTVILFVQLASPLKLTRLVIQQKQHLIRGTSWGSHRWGGCLPHQCHTSNWPSPWCWRAPVLGPQSRSWKSASMAVTQKDVASMGPIWPKEICQKRLVVFLAAPGNL